MNAQERKDLKRAQESQKNWKEKAISHQHELKRLRTRTHDLETSRDFWREKAKTLLQSNQEGNLIKPESPPEIVVPPPTSGSYFF